MRIPFVDLHAQYLAHQDEIDAAIRDVIAKTAFIGGEFVREFEQEYAAAYGVGTASPAPMAPTRSTSCCACSASVPGDEVITTATSWISTSETIAQAGARPVFVDMDEYGNIDVELVAASITPRTRAIIPVHLYGQAAQVEVLEQLAAARGIQLIEDCAQAHLRERRGPSRGHVRHCRARSASIRARIWARTATPARSSRTTTSWRDAAGCTPTTARW